MKLVTYSHEAHGVQHHAGLLQGDRILNAARLLDAERPLSMRELLDMGPTALSRLDAAASRFAADHAAAVFVPREIAVPAWESRLAAPLPDPPSIRDFYAFEQHVAAGYRKRGRDLPAAWYEVPVFFFMHTADLLGPNDAVAKPAATAELDFELELAAVIGRAGRDIAVDDAWSYVAGFTIMNDWSARDLQRQEMSLGLGPAKGKDFASSFGPAIVTIDELRDRIDGGRIDLAMSARINDEEVSRDSSASMHWTFPQLIAHASRHATLRPGDLIGSGTCGTGCLLELEVHPWLEPGDEVELEIERLGRLRSPIV
jgi:fumarylacetoacetate (FAA) hydrolase